MSQGVLERPLYGGGLQRCRPLSAVVVKLREPRPARYKQNALPVPWSETVREPKPALCQQNAVPDPWNETVPGPLVSCPLGGRRPDAADHNS